MTFDKQQSSIHDHTFTKLVSPTSRDNICYPSGLKATELASYVCPASNVTSFLADTDYTFTNLSPLSEAIRCPSGLEDDRMNPIRVSSQRLNPLPARHRPHLHRVVPTSRNNMLPNRTEGDRINTIRVSSPATQKPLGFDTGRICHQFNRISQQLFIDFHFLVSTHLSVD
jgi:hypothetical protein